MTDQANNLRRQAWQHHRNARYVSVSSGKGGVGKSNFVVNLAYWLARLGKKVLVFDADLSLANVDILLSVSVAASIRKYLAGTASLDEVLRKNVYGFDLLPASSGFVELTNLSEAEYGRLFDIFVQLDKQYDYVIFDTGAGIADSVIRFASLADDVIVITQPEPTAITDAYAFMKVAHQNYGIDRMLFLLNRVDDMKSAQEVYDGMNQVANRFLKIKLEYLGAIIDDPYVRRAVKAQKPLSELNPKSPYVRDVQAIARRMTGAKPEEKRSVNLYSMLKGVFK